MSLNSNKAALQKLCMNVFEQYGYSASLEVMDSLVAYLECDEEAFIDMCRDELERVVESYKPISL